MQEIKRLQRAGGMVVFGKGSANHSLLLSELFSFLTLLNPSRPAAHGSPMAGARSAGASLSREPVTGDRTGWGVGQTQQDIGSQVTGHIRWGHRECDTL